MLKKILLVSVLAVALIAYAVWNMLSSRPVPVADATTTPSASSTPQLPATPTTGAYKDGTYTGTVANAIYGPLQLQAVITNGSLTDVVALQYPNASGHTSDVSASALPALKQEAISIQGAKVRVVSGATQTSEAYVVSLTSALAQAQ